MAHLMFKHKRFRFVYRVAFCAALITVLVYAIDPAIAQMPSPDTLSTSTIFPKKGRPFSIARIHSIGNGNLEYVAGGSLHDFPLENIRKIKSESSQFMIVSDTLFEVKRIRTQTYPRFFQPYDSTWSKDPHIDYGVLASIHAEMHITPTGGIVAGFILAPTVIFPVAIAYTPSNPGREYIQDQRSYSEIPEYRKAFDKQAGKIKRRGVLMGVSGFAVMVSAIAIASVL